MTHTAAVVVIMGRTEGLWWEIETALELVPRKRLLFFFPFVDKSDASHSRLAEYVDAFKRWNLSGGRYRQMQAACVRGMC